MGKLSSFLLSERSVRLPSWRAVVLVAVLGIAVLWVFLAHVHDFLAKTEVSGGRIAVVEGWCSDALMEKVLEFYEAGTYETFYVTGVPVSRGRYTTGMRTTDELTARSMVKLGIPEEYVRRATITEAVRGDRTLQMAHRFREILEAEAAVPEQFDILTDGIHGYRSRLIFQKVFPESEVGILSLPTDEYDPERWWAYSGGVKKVINELISVVYQRMRGFELE